MEENKSTKEYWQCPNCHTVNSGKFCINCGQARPIKEEKKEEEPASSNDTFQDAQFTRNTASKSTGTMRKAKQPKEHQSHPVLTIVLAALVGLGAGFGGGYLATSQNSSSSGKTTIVYATPESSETASTTASTSSGTLTVNQVATLASPMVVEIQTEVSTTTYGFFGGTYTSQAAGSGVIISDDGYIITNNHVVEDATKVSVTLSDGTSYDAQIVGADSKSDIAVIKIEATGLTAAVIGDSDSIQVGDTAIVIGNPLGTLGGTVTDGIISAVNREMVIDNQSMTLIQTNAAINNGNSGGGLFNDRGELVGIVNAKDSGVTSSGSVIEGLGFAIPINTAISVAEDLIENGYVTNRPVLGVSLQNLNQDYGEYTAGLYIVEIYEGGGAEAAGLQAYDKIVAADGTEVNSYTELSKILNEKSVGDTITLTIVRNQETMDVEVTLTGTLASMQESANN